MVIRPGWSSAFLHISTAGELCLEGAAGLGKARFASLTSGATEISLSCISQVFIYYQSQIDFLSQMTLSLSGGLTYLHSESFCDELTVYLFRKNLSEINFKSLEAVLILPILLAQHIKRDLVSKGLFSCFQFKWTLYQF